MNTYFDTLAYNVGNSLKHHDLPGGDKPIGTPEPIPPHLHHPDKITNAGKTYLWIVFGIMTFGFVVFTAVSQKVAYRYRTLYVTTLLINGIAAISYFAMATGIGEAYIPEGPGATSPTRQIFVARYIDWLFTTPLLLLDLTLLAGLPAGEIIVVVIADIIMIVTGLIGGLHPSLHFRWGFFTFSCAALLYVFYALVGSARSYAFVRSPKVGSLYNQLSVVLVIVWTLYPVVFVFAEGTGKISSDTEVLYFCILDTLAKPVWGAWLLFATPDEGHFVLPESLSRPVGTGYGALSQQAHGESEDA
ncbi:unnamed protein product [Sympodiomycopsis kandeliae]